MHHLFLSDRQDRALDWTELQWVALLKMELPFWAIPQESRKSMKMRSGPWGVHLFDRNSGLNILLDELAPAPQFWARTPRQVSVALTNACDLACAYCFAPKYPAKLDANRLMTWMDELDRHNCLGIGFGGGEPTLHPELAAICRHGAQRTGLAITLTTHAHRWNERLAGQLAGNVHFIRVSMDGVGATYERLRGRCFDVLLDQLRLVRSVSRFGINYVVNTETLPDLDRAIAVALECNAAEFLLLPERPTRNRPGIDSDTMDSLRDWIARYKEALPLLISDYAAKGLPVCKPLFEEDTLGGYAHINASGQIMRSSFDHDGIQIGERGLMEALDELRNFARSAQNEGLVELRF
jgi:MoaA/NifB/PqqE/SkfB family radical SAM enzyme